MRDFEREKKEKALKIGGIVVVPLVILAVILGFKGCSPVTDDPTISTEQTQEGEKETNEAGEIVDIEDATTPSKEEIPTDPVTGELDIEKIEENRDSSPIGGDSYEKYKTDEEKKEEEAAKKQFLEKLEAEEGITEDVIEKLREQINEEGIDPNIRAEAWEDQLSEKVKDNEDLKEDETVAPIESESESTTEVNTEATETTEATKEDTNVKPSDTPETDPNGEEYERQFNEKEPPEPVLGADGYVEKTVIERVEDAYIEGSGPAIGRNSSATVNMRETVIKNLYTTDDGRDKLGDTMMFGDLAIKVEPFLSEKGYTVETYDNTVEMTFGVYGKVYITKVNDFDASSLSLLQVCELGGIENIGNASAKRPSGGTYARHSYEVISEDDTRAISYYSCPVGTYQILSISDTMHGATNLTINVSPDETINSLPTNDMTSFKTVGE